jgi:chromosome segregation protein
MQFTRLHLHGFKSFVEPTDLEIPSGLTGIVGPNGCGKSNLVEALRWVMGENSPKRMRGAEMDDVIFAGTATRPSRNIAEVALELDNSGRSATSEYNNADELQVRRQIERGSGSDYRINGRPVRQRDVQLLFADQATGAHSTNLVGQGQIDGLIRAKPQDRRVILEEASGTAGLQARRHEAELKLKAAEQNILRVDDVLKAYDVQLRNLRQQVRQASRYKNLAEHIRRAEAALLHLRWAEAEGNAVRVKDALLEAERRANDLLAVVTRGHTTRTEIAAELPPLRQIETAAAAIVQKLTLAREQIEAEVRRVDEEKAAHEHRRVEAQVDREREDVRRKDAQEAITRLEDERQKIARTGIEIGAQLPQASEELAAVNAEVEGLDSALSHLVEAAANAEAHKQALVREIEALGSRQADLAKRRSELDAQRVRYAAEAAGHPDSSLAAALVDASEKELARRRTQAETAEVALRAAETMQNEKRGSAQEADAKLTRLKAENEAIATLLDRDDEAKQVIDIVTVDPGFEKALAVALGEALTAALDEKAAMHWRALPSFASSASMPAGVMPIAQHVNAPAALARALSYVGLVDDAATGARAAASMQPGQIIVSRDGWAWRWDGFTVTPQAKTATALHMQQKNRREALGEEIATAEAATQKATQALNEATAYTAERQAEDKHARTALQAAFAALNDARAQHGAQERVSAAVVSRLAAIDDNLRQISLEQEQVRTRVIAVEDEQHILPDGDASRAEIAAARAHLSEARARQMQKQGERERLLREQDLCEARRAAIAEEIAAWQARAEAGERQLKELAERLKHIESELAQLQGRPGQLAEARAKLLTELSEAEAKRKSAADNLIAAEQKLNVIEQQVRQDETVLGAAREERVRAEGNVQAATEQFNSLRERMQEKLGCGPEELPAIAGFAKEEMPNAFELEQALGRYLRERENMGPVNLRAETEAQAIESEIDKLQKEKDDLNAAIAKLRQGISQLNREARERLHNAFSSVNERFQALFTRLFDGGRAYLELIDDEDPLNAGLEIFASPPGKKMQILSLLSGGERTLTALALLFAVFQTNPSPICVLDEAEAALDESNIDRFCHLVEDIGRETGTRFLIITHQRLTMARMDRLYGVTMSEKGVSQLVSVNLAEAVALRDGEVPENFSAGSADAEVKAA